MAQKIRLGLLFGGKSAEHEVSLQSAKNVLAALDRDKYDITLIGVDKAGRWYHNDDSHFLLNAEDPRLIRLNTASPQVALIAGDHGGSLISMENANSLAHLDVVFPLIHGPFGEDGSLQGLLKMADLPFVGCDVAASAAAMDKDLMKKLLIVAGIPTAPYLCYQFHHRDAVRWDEVAEVLGEVVFVKPANMGSSVGISRVTNAAELEAAVDLAFEYDHKILIESFIDGREIECAVLGNEAPRASIAGEIVPNADFGFYSYDAKYIDEKGATLIIPAELTKDQLILVQETAVKGFLALGCQGMARVDFFLTPSGALYLNELNTIPGFTKISMYPMLWNASGLSYSGLIDELIQLAMAAHQRRARLKTTY